jgi:hypothetical protein
MTTKQYLLKSGCGILHKKNLRDMICCFGIKINAGFLIGSFRNCRLLKRLKETEFILKIRCIINWHIKIFWQVLSSNFIASILGYSWMPITIPLVHPIFTKELCRNLIKWMWWSIFQMSLKTKIKEKHLIKMERDRKR